MKTMALRGRIVTNHEVWPEGTVILEGGRIAEVSRELLEADEVHKYAGHLLCPGFVDLQVNGSFGVDAASEPGRVSEFSRKLLATGTTPYLPTLISSPRRYTRKHSPSSPTWRVKASPAPPRFSGYTSKGRSSTRTKKALIRRSTSSRPT